MSKKSPGFERQPDYPLGIKTADGRVCVIYRGEKLANSKRAICMNLPTIRFFIFQRMMFVWNSSPQQTTKHTAPSKAMPRTGQSHVMERPPSMQSGLMKIHLMKLLGLRAPWRFIPQQSTPSNSTRIEKPNDVCVVPESKLRGTGG